MGRKGSRLVNFFFEPISGDDRCDHIAIDIRQAEVAACVAIGEMLVINAEQMQLEGEGRGEIRYKALLIALELLLP